MNSMNGSNGGNGYRKIIAIDFDGTLCKSAYPDIGEPNWPVIWQAQKEQKEGAVLVLWTCRCGEYLTAAIEACKAWGLEFDAVNDNLDFMQEAYGNNCRKISATEYWDDRAVSLDDIMKRQSGDTQKITRQKLTRLGRKK